MPELPEVETIARELAPLVLGATIADALVLTPRTLRSADPDAFRRAVVGRRIEGVGRRAKLLTIELDDGTILAIHLKMTGQLFVLPTERAPDRHTRVVFRLGDGRAIEFRDVRRFGRIGLARRDPATGELVGELGGVRQPPTFGPEPLDPAFTAAAFQRRLAGRRGRLKSLLTDQAFLAGVGNIYADEALWAARLHPLRSAASVGPGAARRLHRELRRILGEAIERRGASVDDYTAPEGNGSMQDHLVVYQRTGEPCPRCQRPIRRIVLGGRATHFCSACQRLPAAERAAVRAILRSMEPPVRSSSRPGTRARRRGPRWTHLAGSAATSDGVAPLGPRT
ncbi:MAG TPA: bifunctional DNA-formamidopyrimidine glycosylase/DNA-(apurinic or apyrimidinic site) lyase [Candidatus Binatia bacterium]|nr:bifunctional DNA-formamidopyrimidine glycosylase/DNA-(apurinic or apyrimidinic site) lyase [Candidatus Binatia bacterium]